MYISYILWKSSSDWWSHGSRPWHPAVPPPNAGQSVEAVQNQFEAFKWGISISKSIYNIYITGGYPYLKVWPRICWMLVNMCVFNNTTWGLNGMWIMDRMGYWYYKTLCSISVCMFQNWEFKQQKSHLLKPTTMGICYGILMRYVTSTMIVGVWKWGHPNVSFHRTNKPKPSSKPFFFGGFHLRLQEDSSWAISTLKCPTGIGWSKHVKTMSSPANSQDRRSREFGHFSCQWTLDLKWLELSFRFSGVYTSVAPICCVKFTPSAQGFCWVEFLELLWVKRNDCDTDSMAPGGRKWCKTTQNPNSRCHTTQSPWCKFHVETCWIKKILLLTI